MAFDQPSETEGQGLTVSFVEHTPHGTDSSPKGSAEVDQSRVTRIIDIAYDDLYKAIRQILGFPSYIYNAASGEIQLNRWLPWQFPEFASSDFTAPTFLYASKVDWIGLGKTSGSRIGADGSSRVQYYPKARLTITYTTRTYYVRPRKELEDGREFNRFVTEVIKPQGEVAVFPRGMLKLVGSTFANAGINEALAKLLPKARIVFTWHNLPSAAVPWENILLAVGKANNSAFVGRYFTYTPGTLVVADVDTPEHVSPTGERTFDISYHCLFDPNGHHKVLYQTAVDNIGFVECSVDGITHPIGTNSVHKIDYVDYDAYLFTVKL